MTLKDYTREIYVVMEQFCILLVAVIACISACVKMAQNHTHTLYQCQILGFIVVR